VVGIAISEASFTMAAAGTARPELSNA